MTGERFEGGRVLEGYQLPADWPTMSLAEADALLTAPGAMFEMDEVLIRGVKTRVWKNCPPSLLFLARHSRSHGERLISIYEDERISFEASFRATAALAAELRRLGIGKGDRVALAMVNLPEWPVAFFAITALGAIAVPLNAWWTGPELEYGLADSGATLLICDAPRWERIRPHRAALPALEHVLVSRARAAPEGATRLEEVIGAPPEWADLPDADLPEAAIDPDDDAFIFYTSGTTGNPKGALGTHRNILTNILSGAVVQARTLLRRGEALPAKSEPRIGLMVIPLFHVSACSASLMGSMAIGHTTIFMRKWDPLEALVIIEREQVNITGGVPTIAWQLLEHPERGRFDLSSLTLVSYGGAPSAPELVRLIWKEFGALPGNGWGMTETTATLTAHVGEDYLNRPESCGPPVPVAEVKVTGPDGAALPAGQLGELWCKGPQVVKGYWNKPEATAAAFVDGWVRTGDLGFVDEEGFCFVVDRAKDIIIRGGENIYSSEVENVLYDHPAVTDAALVGIPHRILGEEPAAIVHLAPGGEASEEELKAWVRARLAVFKTPVRILFLPEPLPRNANGKILKKELKALF
jgi:acyl-CoA synthetase (AMP-forming)/AMP-acid ligase II